MVHMHVCGVSVGAEVQGGLQSPQGLLRAVGTGNGLKDACEPRRLVEELRGVPKLQELKALLSCEVRQESKRPVETWLGTRPWVRGAGICLLIAVREAQLA